jgi:hypothetical protein
MDRNAATVSAIPLEEPRAANNSATCARLATLTDAPSSALAPSHFLGFVLFVRRYCSVPLEPRRQIISRMECAALSNVQEVSNKNSTVALSFQRPITCATNGCRNQAMLALPACAGCRATDPDGKLAPLACSTPKDRRLLRTEVDLSLKCSCNPEQQTFLKVVCDDLQSNRHARQAKATRYRQRRKSRKAHRNRELTDTWIALSVDCEWRCNERMRGGEKSVYLVEYSFDFANFFWSLANSRVIRILADPLRLSDIGVHNVRGFRSGARTRNCLADPEPRQNLSQVIQRSPRRPQAGSDDRWRGRPSQLHLHRGAHDAAKANMAGRGVDRLALARRGPIAQAIVGRAEMRTALAIARPSSASASPHA